MLVATIIKHATPAALSDCSALRGTSQRHELLIAKDYRDETTVKLHSHINVLVPEKRAGRV